MMRSLSLKPLKKIFILSLSMALIFFFQNCGEDLKSANTNSNIDNDQCFLMKVQNLAGAGQVSLEQAINNQENNSHSAAHAAHAGDDGKIGDHKALLDLFPRASSANTNVALKGGMWSTASHWSKGRLPQTGDDVYVPSGISMIYDLYSNEKLNRVGIDGELHFAVNKDTRIKFDTFITGPQSIFTIGTEENPVTNNNKAELIVHRDRGAITNENDPTLLGHGLVTHGVVRVTGHAKELFLRVNANHHPRAGDNVLLVDEKPNGWNVGDKLVIGATQNIMRNGSLTESQDEVVTIKSIQTNSSPYRIELNESLDFDHVPPQHNKSDIELRVPVANFSRNIIFTTEKEGALFQGNGNTVPVSERGHVMFMHNADVRVLNASFVELGRTDKSKFFSDSNVAGRYSLHFHRTGVIGKLGKPALAKGNAVWGSPGWGIVHHDANLDVIGNAVFGVLGSGIVAEAGNETGDWTDNIVIQTHGEVITFNAEQSADSNGVSPVGHPAYQAEIKNNSFMQGEAYGMKSRLLVVTHNVAVSANGAGFSFWPHGNDGPSHINAHSGGYEVLHGYDPFYGQSEIYPGKVPTRFFFGNEVIASRHALNTSANKIAHRHDMDVIIEDLLTWNVDQPIMSFYQENYIIKDCIFIKGERNVVVGGGLQRENRATHIHDPVDFKMINNYWEGYDVITKEPMQLILGNTVVGSSITEQTGPRGMFQEGATADNDSIDLIDNSTNWRNNPSFKNRVGHLSARVNVEKSILVMSKSYDRFSIFVEKTDTFGDMTLEMGSPRNKSFRGAHQKEWWKHNAANRGYYQQAGGEIYLLTEAVVGDRVTGTVGSIKVAIRLDFIQNPEEDFPYGGQNLGALPSELDENGIGEFKIVDLREIGERGNLLHANRIPARSAENPNNNQQANNSNSNSNANTNNNNDHSGHQHMNDMNGNKNEEEHNHQPVNDCS